MAQGVALARRSAAGGHWRPASTLSGPDFARTGRTGLGLFARGEMTFREALRIVNELQGEKYLVGSTAAFLPLA